MTFNRRIGIFLISAITTVPLFYSTDFLSSYVFTQTMLFKALALALCVPLLLTLINDKVTPKWSIVSLAVVVYLAALIVTSITSVDIQLSFFGDWERFGSTIDWIFVAIFFFACTIFLRSEREWLYIFSVSTVVASLVSLFGFAQLLFPEYIFFTGSRVFSTLGNPGFLAGYLLLSMGVTTYLISNTQRRKLRAVLFILLIMQVGALLLTDTRAALLGLVLGVVAGVVLQFKTLFKNKTVFSVIIVVVAVIGLMGYQTIKQRILLDTSSANEEIGRRVLVWNSGVDAFWESPLVGFGPELFSYVYYATYPAAIYRGSDATYGFDDAHNTIVNHLAETGIVGATSYIIFLIAPLFVLFKKREKYNAVLLGSLIAYYIYLQFFFHSIADVLVLVLILAFIGRKHSHDKVKGQTQDSFLLRSFVIVLVMGTFITYITKPFVASSLARQAESNNNNVTKQLLYATALNLTKSGDRIILDSYRNHLPVFDGQTETVALYEDLYTKLSEYIERHPYDIRMMLITADISRILSFSKDDYLPRSINLYSMVIDLAPTYPLAYQKRGLSYLDFFELTRRQEEQLYETAIADLQMASDLAPNVFENSLLLHIGEYILHNDSTDIIALFDETPSSALRPREWFLAIDTFDSYRDTVGLRFLSNKLRDTRKDVAVYIWETNYQFIWDYLSSVLASHQFEIDS